MEIRGTDSMKECMKATSNQCGASSNVKIFKAIYDTETCLFNEFNASLSGFEGALRRG